MATRGLMVDLSCDERRDTMEKRVRMRDGEERSDEQKVISYCPLVNKVVASLLPSFDPRPISPRH